MCSKMTNCDSKNNGIFSRSLMKDLCRQITVGLGSHEFSEIYKKSIIRLIALENQENSSFSDSDEFTIIDSIKKTLARYKDESATSTFDSCHRTLIRMNAIKNRTAILTFLLKMSECGVSGGLAERPKSMASTSKQQLSSKSSGFFSRSSLTSTVTNGAAPGGRGQASELCAGAVDSVEQLYPQLSMESVASWSASVVTNTSRSSLTQPETQQRPHCVSASASSKQRAIHSLPGYQLEMSETVLIEELVLCMQGIEGKLMKADNEGGFKLASRAALEWRAAPALQHLMELGFLHNKARALCAAVEAGGGSIAQGLVCGIRAQLAEYYRSVANLHAQVHQAKTFVPNEDSPLYEEAGAVGAGGGGLTLLRVCVWAQEPFAALQCVCDVANAWVGSGKRGGAAVGAAVRLLEHGNPQRRMRCTLMLTSALRPLFALIRHWMVDGQLLDAHDEFFVCSASPSPTTAATGANSVRSGQQQQQLQRRFVLREALVPGGVMSRRQAEVVLNTGKCTHFLNDICTAQERDKQPLAGCRLQLKLMDQPTDDELLELLDATSDLWQVLEGAFVETSRLELDVLISQYKLFEHFRGLRLYMLLGQGDFYRYFLELVHEELRKSACAVYQHKVAAIMETAMRQTNAQFEDADVVGRVGVKLLLASGGEDGWDIFNITYNLPSPLDNILSSSEQTYSQMFNFLCRLKRVNLDLSHAWKKQSMLHRRLCQHRKLFQELMCDLGQVRILTGEMVHFLHQFEYYIMSEVLECEWSAFSVSLQQAASLEQVCAAHNRYLSNIMAMTFQDTLNQNFATQFRILNELVLELCRLADEFVACAEGEMDRQLLRMRRCEEEGTDQQSEAAHAHALDAHHQQLVSFRARTRLLTQSYQDVLKKLLLDLSTHTELNLQFLSSRLDFNEFYRRSDARLTESTRFSRSTDYVTFANAHAHAPTTAPALASQ